MREQQVCSVQCASVCVRVRVPVCPCMCVACMCVSVYVGQACLRVWMLVCVNVVCTCCISASVYI